LCSCLWVRNRVDLTNALDITPTYLRNPYSEQGTVIDYRNWQISLGRRFRSLKIWFVMRSYGLNGMKAHIRKGVALGDVFAEKVRGRPDLFEIVTRPAFGLTVLRVTNGTKASEKGNELTKQVYELVNSRGEIYITSSVIGGVYVVRVVSGSALAEESHVLRAFDILVKTAEEVLRSLL
jgi:aromatic-L-amino-acid/L-tryptophan decarboxylase